MGNSDFTTSFVLLARLMIRFPHAKINLGLHITQKRPDGFHNLETCFFPVTDCCDALEMLDAEEDSFEMPGADWAEPYTRNLVWKAFELFRTYEPVGPRRWILLKKIPTGAGLGGGSSDAAFALRMLAERAGWAPHDPRLFEMAAQLGSDCACFLYDGPTLGSGRGEILQPFAPDLKGYRVELVFPGIHISTAAAFSQVVPSRPVKSIREILSQPPATWRTDLVNDFEASVFSQYPILENSKEELYRKGAVYASLSGSGSALFGLFKR